MSLRCWTLLSSLVFALAAPSGARAQLGASVMILPSAPTTLDRLQITLTVWTSCAIVFSQPPQVSASTIRIDFSEVPPCTLAPPSPWTKVLLAGPLPAGAYKLTVYRNDNVWWSSDFTVTEGTPPPTELFLGQARFQVDVSWQTSQAAGSGYAKPLSDESGYFWFFEPGNAELTIKILDGRPINGHFWIFIASMTDAGFKVVVYDRSIPGLCPRTGCVSRTYVNPLGTNQNFIDTTAF